MKNESVSAVQFRHAIQVGDTVFDIWGGTYKITNVRHCKSKSVFTRDDGHTFDVNGDAQIPVIRTSQTEASA